MSPAKRAIALGVFDGLHIGHAALMRCLLDVCKTKNLTPAVMTFDALPQSLIDKKTIPLINSPDDRVGLIRRLYGIDEIIFLHFDNALASMPWDEFVDRLIIDHGACHLIVGNNFRFGSGASGNSELLQQKCTQTGINCDIIPDVKYDGIVSSSTYIRNLLLAGNIERANVFLGHPHVLTDIVRSGQRLGMSLGAPTLNMRFAPDVLVPAFGVYATKVYIEDAGRECLPAYDGAGNVSPRGVTNIGVRPTVDNSGLVTVETHIPDFRWNLYGHRVRVEFHAYLRQEMRFGSTGELKAQIQKDCASALRYFEPSS